MSSRKQVVMLTPTNKRETIPIEGIIAPYVTTEDECVETKCDPGTLDTPVQNLQVAETLSEKTLQISQNTDPISEPVKLKRELGLWDGVALIVGGTIGSGIFLSPGTVLKYSGSIGMSLIVWILTGFMSAVGALCFAELGTMLPKSGSTYVYVFEAFGPIPAFLVLWITIIVDRPSTRAIIAIVFGSYLLQPLFPDCAVPPYIAVRLVSAAMLLILTYINCIGIKLGTKMQDVLTLLKIFSLLIIIGVGIYYLVLGETGNLENPMEGTIYSASSFATAFYSTLFTYSGWNYLNNITEELKDPYRNLPRAISISITILIIVYTLTNIAYFIVLTPNEILSSNAVALTFGNRTLGILSWYIAISVACSTFGSVHCDFITQSRLTYVAAREGHLPGFLKLINVKSCTPVTAVISTAIIPLILLIIPDIGILLAYTSFSKNLCDFTCVLALLWLRKRDPKRPRPIKVWLGFPIIYLILAIFIAVFPVVQRPLEIGVALGILLLGILIYYFAIRLQIKVFKDILDKVSYSCQMLLLCTEEDKVD